MESYYKALKIEKISPNGFRGDSLAGCIEDNVVSEERIAFYLNGKKLLSVMSIPKEQDCHIVGFLISEGVICDVSQIRHLEIAKDGKSVAIEAEIQSENLKNLFREKTLTSGCCVGVAGYLEGHIVEKVVERANKDKEIFENKLIEEIVCFSTNNANTFEELLKKFFDLMKEINCMEQNVLEECQKSFN